MKKLPIFLLTVIVYSNTLAQNQASKLHELNSLLINTVMQDLFNPPVASRINVPQHCILRMYSNQRKPITIFIGNLQR